MTEVITGEEWRALDIGAGKDGAGFDQARIARDLSAAQERIRRLRMVDVELVVRDRAGVPVPNLRLSIEQQRGDFAWGDCLWSLSTMRRRGVDGQDRERYFSWRFREALNAANCLSYWTERTRNDGPKHEDFLGEPQFEDFAFQVDWCARHGLTAKGHPLFWSIPKAIPTWAQRYPQETMLKFLEVRVRSLCARFRGRVKHWDVINEPMWEAAPQHLAQRHWPHLESADTICDYVEPVLRWAREEDPDACYIINDYGMESDRGAQSPRARDGSMVTAAFQRRRYVDFLRRLTTRGHAPDAVGLQSHTGGWLTPDALTAVWDEIGEAGLPIHITEFWANAGALTGQPPELIAAARADYIALVMTMAYAHPSVEAFYFWSALTDEIGWCTRDAAHGHAGDSGHEPTVIYHRIRQLLRETWWSRETATTDAEGRARVRLFTGEHSVRWTQTPGLTVGRRFQASRQQPGRVELAIVRP